MTIELPKNIEELCQNPFYKIENLFSEDNYVSHSSTLELGLKKQGDKKIDPSSGIYAFWWVDAPEKLQTANRKIAYKGPGYKKEVGKDSKNIVDIEWKFDHPEGLKGIPLYVGKSTNLPKRISQHLLLTRKERLHDKRILKAKPHTTSCQVRVGLEHLFTNDWPDFRQLIEDNLHFSFVVMDGDGLMSERFFMEDFAIGFLRPWFNIDSER